MQLKQLGIHFETRVVSAHRTRTSSTNTPPAQKRADQGDHRGRGRAAHLPGMLAAKTIVPVAGRAGTVEIPARAWIRCCCDCANAEGHSGRYFCHRRSRRGQCGAVRGGVDLPATTANWPNNSTPSARGNLIPCWRWSYPMSSKPAAQHCPFCRAPRWGILGGGQLGRLFTLAARGMGYKVMVLDPDAASPAGQMADVATCRPTTPTQLRCNSCNEPASPSLPNSRTCLQRA